MKASLPFKYIIADSGVARTLDIQCDGEFL